MGREGRGKHTVKMLFALARRVDRLFLLISAFMRYIFFNKKMAEAALGPVAQRDTSIFFEELAI